MAKQAAPPPAGGLLAKYGQSLVKAVDQHKNDETKYSNRGGLPAGLKGVAQLTDMKFDLFETGDNKGEYYFMAMASVLSPAYANLNAAGTEVVPTGGTRTKIQGKFTKIGPEPVCATKKGSRKTQEEHIAWILNEMRKLGAPPASLSAANLETLAAMLKKAKPTFAYETYKFDDQVIENRGGKFFVVAVNSITGARKDVKDGGPFPTEAALKLKFPYVGQPSRVNETWGELCEAPSEDADDGTTVSSEEAPEMTPEEQHATVEPTAEEPVTEPETAVDYSTETDLDVLANAADAGENGAAQERLSALAAEAGCDISTVATWTEGAAIIKAAQEAGPATAAEGEEGPDYAALGAEANAGDAEAQAALTELWADAGLDQGEFETLQWDEVAAKLAELVAAGQQATTSSEDEAYSVGKVGSYLPKTNNPKTKKPYKTPLDVEIQAVNGDKLDLLSMLDRKTVYSGVPKAEFTPLA